MCHLVLVLMMTCIQCALVAVMHTRSTPANTPVVVVGAGAVGLLSAIYLARRGYSVSVFERKPHPTARNVNASASHDYPQLLSARQALSLLRPSAWCSLG
jgi:glycine/D-amino acid oxidase-like deaminating enzyme